MTQVSEVIPNFVQAVSQQSPSLRLPSQLEACENGLPSIIEGMKKRPPLEYVSTISETALSASKIHFSNRDESERYVFVVSNGDLKVFDRDTGVEKTVNTPNGVGYLTATDPKTAFRLLTVVDYTFIVNREVTVAMDPATSPVPPYRALVTIKVGALSNRYVIYIDGSKVAEYVSGTDPDDDNTDKIADRLANGGAGAVSNLVTSLGAGWTISTFGSTIVVKKDDDSSFKISAWDSAGNDSIKITTDRAQRFTDLPEKSPDAQTVEIIGDEGQNEDNYYVKFSANDDTTVSSDGVWVETIAPGIEYAFDKSTMPHVIVRETDGTFTFKEADWLDRTVGDENSAPTPSFVGKKIEWVTFWANRLGFVADDNCILSRGGSEYFDFWPKTAKAVLDDDPIDLAANYTKVAKLKSAIPFDKKLLLFAEQSQWVMEGGTTVTPNNTGLDIVSEYVADEGSIPTAAGTRVFFATSRGGFTAIQEMEVAADIERLEATNASEHVPKYIPSGITDMVATSSEDMLACLAPSEPTNLYVYNWHYSGRNKDQSAWHRFSFTGAEILAIDVYQSELFVLMNKGGKAILGKIFLDPGRVDFPAESYRIHLDYRLDETQATPVYDAGNDQTTITFPFPLTDPHVVDTATKYGDTLAQGSGTVSSIVVPGQVTTFFVGETYEHRFTLSELILRRPSQTGGFTPITNGRLQVKRMSVRYEDTGYFRAEVALQYQTPFVYSFSGKIMGEGSNLIGDIPITDGDFSFPVSSNSKRVSITFINDSILPSNLLMAEWEGEFTSRNKR